jgi:hypothetical protein
MNIKKLDKAAKGKIAEAQIAKVADELTEGIMGAALDAVAKWSGSARLHQRANNKAAQDDMMRRWKMVKVRDKSKPLAATVREFVQSTYGDDMAQTFDTEVQNIDPNTPMSGSQLNTIFGNLARHGLKSGVISMAGETRPDQPGTLSPIGGTKKDQYGRQSNSGAPRPDQQSRPQQKQSAPYATRLDQVFDMMTQRNQIQLSGAERTALLDCAQKSKDSTEFFDQMKAAGLTLTTEIAKAASMADKL